MSGFQHPLLGWFLIVLGVLLAVVCWAPPVWRHVSRIRVTLKPEKGKGPDRTPKGWTYYKFPDGRGLLYEPSNTWRFYELVDGAAEYYEGLGDQQRKVHSEFGKRNKWQWKKRDLVRLLDRTQSFLLDLGDGIDDGTAVTDLLRADIPNGDILAFQKALGRDSQVRKQRLKPIEEWEARMGKLLEFRRDLRADFMRPIPLEPTGEDELIYRVQVRLVSGIRNHVNICHGILREGIHGQSRAAHRRQRGGSA